MRELGDREHEHEVEEQLDEGDAPVLVSAANAQQAFTLGHGASVPAGQRKSPLPRPRPPPRLGRVASTALRSLLIVRVRMIAALAASVLAGFGVVRWDRHLDEEVRLGNEASEQAMQALLIASRNLNVVSPRRA